MYIYECDTIQDAGRSRREQYVYVKNYQVDNILYLNYRIYKILYVY